MKNKKTNKKTNKRVDEYGEYVSGRQCERCKEKTIYVSHNSLCHSCMQDDYLYENMILRG